MPAEICPSLNEPQAAFLALPHKYRAFVAGFGTGKTWVGCADLCSHAWEWPGINAGYFAPTYPLIRDIFFPTIQEVAEDWGLDALVVPSHNEVHLSHKGKHRCTIICRSMDKPGGIIGFKIGKALVDELDTMSAAKARDAWRKIIARMRYNVPGLPNSVSVTTTPEGFRFTHEQFVVKLRKDPKLREMYGIVHASTLDNAENLPDDYIPSLMASYPPNLISAYINGQFTNLSSGAVYPEFSRDLNSTTASIQSGEVLHIGMDFNVQNMSAAISVIRDGLPMTLAEIVKGRDTPDMVRMIRERYDGHQIVIYPDASGQNTSSKGAGLSDLSILRSAGFTVRVAGANPAVRDRVNAVNAMLLNADGERRWLINTEACPTLTECLEQQAWSASGEPDKSTGHDHMNDAAGYFIASRWPLARRGARVFT